MEEENELNFITDTAAAADETTPTNPFDLFVSDCNDIDVEVRISSIKKLTTVAVALDTERTKTELIPYLETLTEGSYNDDEVLLNLAEQLGNFLPFVGGKENAGLVLNVLEKLAGVEESVVREKAVESLKKIANELDPETLEYVFVSMILRLADSEWFTSKSSGVALISVCYPIVSNNVKADLRNTYRVLCQDDSPLVRRAAAAKIGDFAKVLELEYLKNEFIPVFDNFAKDDQDSVRLLSVDVGISIASKLKSKETEDLILTTLTELCGDVSWRVRYQVANQINALQLALGHELTEKYLAAIFQNIVHDTEAQVREAAAKRIVGFCQVLQQTYKENGGKEDVDPIILNQIFPLIQYLDQDANVEVKEALSTVITSLSSLLGVENTKNMLLPLITTSLLNDSSRVRENIIANLNNIISVIGISDIADTVLKIVVDLVNNSASVWRTRRNLIVTISYIAKHSGKEYFDEHLKFLYQKLLSDGVYAVRKTAPLILPILAKNFGTKWAAESVVPEFLAFAKHRHYLYRYVCLFCIDELVSPTLEAKSEEAARPKKLHRLKKETKPEGVAPSSSAALLEKIGGLARTLDDKLEAEWVRESLRVLDEDDVVEDDIKRYAEDTIEMFVRDNDLDISQVSEAEIASKNGDDVYLVGVLGLIQGEFLDALRELALDPVPNVRLKVAKTLSKIIQFNESLVEELGPDYVRATGSDSESRPKTEPEESEDVVMEEEEENEEKGGQEEKDEEDEKEKADQIGTGVADSKDAAAIEVDVASEEEEDKKSLETELVEILEQKLQPEKDNVKS